MTKSAIHLPTPSLQIGFSLALRRLRVECLQDALSQTVRRLDIMQLDRELSEFAPKGDLSSLASKGLRGELLFAVPCVLRSNPRLLGYYRLLLGFSQKAFYGTSFGLSRLKCMEDSGRLPAATDESVVPLCRALSSSASALLAGIGLESVTHELLDDLTLLTLGPQLRGGANVQKGTEGIELVFRAIHQIVKRQCVATAAGRIELLNAAKRQVIIEFAADPDLVIRELMTAGIYRNIIAIEIKGGTDVSNIHNRLGEAEKSHQKARQAGFVECWTVVNVDRLDMAKAKRESPSTNRFYRISDLVAGKGDAYDDFRNRITSLTGIPSKRRRD